MIRIRTAPRRRILTAVGLVAPRVGDSELTPIAAPVPGEPACADRALPGNPCRGGLQSGRRFGLEDGIRLCRAHYGRRARQAERDAAMARGPKPCDACGTKAGFVPRGAAKPARYHVLRDGVRVTLCHSCRWPPKVRAKPEALAAVPVVGVLPGHIEVRLAALALHSERAREGDRIENRRFEAMERGPAAEAAAIRRAARAAIVEGKARERARRDGQGVWERQVVIPEPRLDAPAKAVAKKPAGWRKRKTASTFLHPDPRQERGADG